MQFLPWTSLTWVASTCEWAKQLHLLSPSCRQPRRAACPLLPLWQLLQQQPKSLPRWAFFCFYYLLLVRECVRASDQLLPFGTRIVPWLKIRQRDVFPFSLFNALRLEQRHGAVCEGLLWVSLGIDWHEDSVWHSITYMRQSFYMQKDNIACKLQKQMAWNLSTPENRTEDFLNCLVNLSGNSVPSTLVPFCFV